MPDDFRKKIFSLIDLTSLNDSDTPDTITALCKKTESPLGHVAAVCIYPSFVKQAQELLRNSAIKIATVANFPSGNESLNGILNTINSALQDGADEIDLVLPYQSYLAGKENEALKAVRECKQQCGDKLLKVILETGAFPDTATIFKASKDVLRAGADFIKTSTGKHPTGATMAAAEAMLQAIHELTPEIKRTLGFKVSGGVRTLEQAKEYYQLASKIMGIDWISPDTFRIGTSRLLDDLYLL